MSDQVETLRQLLTRVQYNRSQPRTVAHEMMAQSSVAQPLRGQPIAHSELAALPAPAPAAVQVPQALSAARPQGRPAPISLPPEPDTAVQFGRPQPLTMPSDAPAPIAAAARAEGAVIAEPVPAAPTRPIAETVSKSPELRPVTFGDLLWRSLALRPR